MPTVTRSEFDRWQIISAACLISATGAIFYNILPIFVGAMQDTFQLDHARTGFIPSVFYTGFGLISASAYFWIRRVNWRKLALACIPATLLSLLLLVHINSYGGLLAAILLAGIGFGIMYSLGSTIIGDTAKPARYFGMKIGAEVFIGVILLFSIPSLVMPRWGFPGTVYALAGCILALGLSFVWIPEQGLKKQVSTAYHTGAITFSVAPVWYALAALLLFFSGMTAIWTFMERIAANAGINASIIGTILAVSLLAGLVGAFSAALISGRFGRLKPIGAGLFLCITSVLMLLPKLTVATYTIAVCIFNSAFPFTIPFLLVLVADYDFNGRYIVLTVPAISLGIVSGPAIAGLLAGSVGFIGCVVYSCIVFMLTMALVIIALRKAS